MFNKVKIDREIYDNFMGAMRSKSTIDFLHDKLDKLREQLAEYQSQYVQITHENRKLYQENGYLKALFEKEEDTQIIKYQGKLYYIESMAHFTEVNEPDTLDINAVCVEEVNKDGKSKM